MNHDATPKLNHETHRQTDSSLDTFKGGLRMANHIDPVCEMQVEEKDAAGLSEHQGMTYYFDSEECMTKFNLNPEQYANKSEAGA